MINSQLSSLVNTISVDSDHSTADFVSTFNPKKYWKIKNNDYDTFWNEYCDIIQNIATGRYNGQLNVAEKVGKYCPIICDCNIKFQKTDSPGLLSSNWSDKFIIELIYAYQSAIADTLLIDGKSNDVEYFALVMSEEYIDTEGHSIHSYRIQFPFCRVEPIIQKRLIRVKAMHYLRRRNVIANFPESPIGDWTDMISSTSTDEFIVLYGSVSAPGKKSLSIHSSIYERITIDNLENNFIETIELEEALTDFIKPILHSYVSNKLIEENSTFFDMESEESKITEITYYIPFILSINYCATCIRAKPSIDINEINSSGNKYYSTPNQYNAQNTLNESDIDMAEKLLPMLSISRINNEHFWLDIGKALFNSDKSENKERAYKLWVNFTERSENRDRDDCETFWETFSIENPFSIRTIAWYARIDAQIEYDRWHKYKYSPFLERSLSCTHDDVALAFYWIYWLDFVCGSVKNKTWYVFSKNILREADSGREIRTKMGTDFKIHYEILQKELSDRVFQTGNELEKTQWQMEIKKVGELIKKLKTVNFKQNIMTALLDLFKDDNFNKYANTNVRLFGCPNGIIECCDKYAIHRPGKPEDYVTLSTPIDYPTKYGWESQGVKKFMIWLKQIFIYDDLKNYFLRLIASCLRSKNKEKILGVLSGSMGNNSKSMMKRCVETVFGPYSYTFPNHAFTKAQNGGASPAFAAARFAKIGWVSEPAENAHLQADQIKSKTGMDKANDRMLYDNGGEYEIMYTLFLICNKIPLIPGADNAIMNRLRVIPFESIWSLDAPENVDEQYKLRNFKLDQDFESKIPFMASSALWVFVETYKDYCSKGLGQPAIVTKFTKKYFEENDLYKAFIDECLQPATIPGSMTEAKPKGEVDLTKTVKFTELYTIFKSWVRITFPSMKVPDAPLFLFHMNQRIGKPMKKVYKGIVIKDTVATI